MKHINPGTKRKRRVLLLVTINIKRFRCGYCGAIFFKHGEELCPARKNLPHALGKLYKQTTEEEVKCFKDETKQINEERRIKNLFETNKDNPRILEQLKRRYGVIS